MKRGALSEPEGALQRSEKAAKEGDAEPEMARADPLLVFLQELSAEDANEWHAVLRERRVRSLDDLVGLAQDAGWEGFLQELRDAKERVLASKLNAWRQELGLREPSGGDSPEASILDDVLPVPENSRRLSLEEEKKEVIPDVPLTSRSRLGPFLKFVNREKSINVLLKHAADQYAKYLHGFGEKEAQFAACSGGPGLGKTTFCRKAFSRAVDGSEQDKATMWEGVDDGFRRIVQDCVEWGRQYRISFGRPTPLQEAEALPGNRVKSFAVRLAAAATGEQLPVFNWAALPEGSALLRDVVHRLSGGNKEALIVLNLDETNVVMSSGEGIQYLKSVLAALMEVNQQRAGFVFVTLSGTNARPLHDLLRESSSGVAPKEIPLPLLEVNHMQEVLLDLQQGQQGGRSLGQQLDFVLEVLGGVPRYLEILAFLLGQQGEHFTHAQYCAQLKEPGTEAPRLLEQVKDLILQQYGNDFAAMLSGIPRLKVVSHSLFGWRVSRDTEMGKHSVGELEARGCVFLTGDEPDATLHVPLVLLLFMSQGMAQTDPPMLLKHFDVVLSPDENERASLALLALKCAALQEMFGVSTVKDLLSTDLSSSWDERVMTFDQFELCEAKTRITKTTWNTALSKLMECGAFVVNCKGAPFADMIIVPKGGTFVIFLQEKQRERAKEQLLDERTVPTLKAETVQEEHAKCDVSTPHLFVLITDERFDAYDELKSNEVVLPYDQHGAVMGPLLALLRRFNHCNKRKIAVK